MPMRLLLAFLLAMTFAFNPAVAPAKQMDCASAMSVAMDQADMSSMDMTTAANTAKNSPAGTCCPHPTKDCLKACAGMLSVSAAVLPTSLEFSRLEAPFETPAAASLVVASFEPRQFDRPPKSSV